MPRGKSSKPKAKARGKSQTKSQTKAKKPRRRCGTVKHHGTVSLYGAFYREEAKKMKGETLGAMSKAISAKWKKMSDSQKAKWQSKADKMTAANQKKWSA